MGLGKEFVLLGKENSMSEQNHPNEKPDMVSEPTMEAYPNIAGLKASITRYIQASEDSELLQEIYTLLQAEKPVEKPLNLSRHIDKVFSQYPETLSKLAQ